MVLECASVVNNFCSWPVANGVEQQPPYSSPMGERQRGSALTEMPGSLNGIMDAMFRDALAAATGIYRFFLLGLDVTALVAAWPVSFKCLKSFVLESKLVLHAVHF